MIWCFNIKHATWLISLSNNVKFLNILSCFPCSRSWSVNARWEELYHPVMTWTCGMLDVPPCYCTAFRKRVMPLCKAPAMWQYLRRSRSHKLGWRGASIPWPAPRDTRHAGGGGLFFRAHMAEEKKEPKTNLGRFDSSVSCEAITWLMRVGWMGLWKDMSWNSSLRC